MRFFIIVFFILNVHLPFGQPSREEIDKNIRSVNKLITQRKHSEAISLSKKNLRDAQEIAYSLGILEASWTLSFLLNKGSEVGEADDYLEIAEKENLKVGSKDYEYRINEERSRRAFQAKLYERSIQKLRLNLRAGGHIEAIAAANIAESFYHLSLDDSTTFYLKRAYHVMKKENVKVVSTDLAVVCINLGLDFDRRKQPDSARHYTNEGFVLAKNHSIPEAIEGAKKAFGAIALSANKIDSALIYYHEALSIAKELNLGIEIEDLYKTIADIYKKKGNAKKQAEYLEMQKNLSDTLNRMHDAPSVVESITRDHEQQLNQKKKQEIILIIGICALAGGAIFIFTYYKIKKYKSEKKVLLKERTDLISSISKNKTESEIEAIGILAELARKKDPAFFLKFNELYPDFKEKLVKKFPDLSLSDIEFCSYLRMNFDTKEIAIYANMTVRSVEAKKYRLRKKMKISSMENMNLLVIDL